MTTQKINFKELLPIGFNTKDMTPERIREIRRLYKVTQKSFADLITVNYETYRSWEEGRRYCSSPGYAILTIAESYPDIFLKNRNKILEKIIGKSVL